MCKPLVSVIITTYRRSNQLIKAIESVLQQSYKNIEIIVVDDNSAFPQERVISRKYAKQFKMIKLIENDTNLGGALSRNVGIDHARGELISFLDDDDIYMPTRIEEMVKVYEKNKQSNVGLIYCDCYVVDKDDNVLRGYENDLNGMPIYEHMMNCIAGTSMWLAPKNVLVKVGKFEQTPNKQDSILLLKILINGYNIYSTGKKLVYYYEHDGLKISGLKVKNVEGWLIYRDWCRKNYDKLSKNQIKNVEANFSHQLISIYIPNEMYLQARKEFKNICKYKFLSSVCLKSFIKCYFPRLYIKKLNLGRK